MNFFLTVLLFAMLPFVLSLGPSSSSQKSEQALTEDFKASEPQTTTLPLPTKSDVPYGTHPKQVLHFWQAASPQPTPLLFYVHGGSWQAGDRMRGMAVLLPAMLEAGISVVSIEYRFIKDANVDGITPPVKAPLYDAARALQFVRSKATEWNIDKKRIGASGVSAGAFTSLWLAFHNDLEDPQSFDPVARESTRLYCVGVMCAQTTLDPKLMKEWTPNSFYGGHAFGIYKQVKGKIVEDFDQFLARRQEILGWIEEYSPYSLVSADDPPVYLFYKQPPCLGHGQKDPTHSANFGIKLLEKLRKVGVPCELVYPGSPDTRFSKVQDYLIDRLKNSTAKAD